MPGPNCIGGIQFLSYLPYFDQNEIFSSIHAIRKQFNFRLNCKRQICFGNSIYYLGIRSGFLYSLGSFGLYPLDLSAFVHPFPVLHIPFTHGTSSRWWNRWWDWTSRRWRMGELSHTFRSYFLLLRHNYPVGYHPRYANLLCPFFASIFGVERNTVKRKMTFVENGHMAMIRRRKC